MRVSPPGSSATAVLTSVSSSSNSLTNYNNSGMGSVPGFAGAKNGVPQARTTSPATTQQGLPSDWSNMNDGFSNNSLVQPAGVVINSQQSLSRTSSPMPNVTKQLTTLTNVNKIPPVATQPQMIPNSTMQTQVKQRAVQLPSGITIPPGMVLARNQMGQLLLVNSSTLASTSATTTSTVLATQTATSGTVTTLKNSGVGSPQTVVVNSAMGGQVVARTFVPVSNTITVKSTVPVSAKQPVAVTKLPTTVQATTPTNARQMPLSQEDEVSVSKCRNFLTTLIKLASAGGQSAETVSNVKKLVQNLIDDKIEPDHFTQQLQIELNSAPQPYLVPFLKRSLPLLRQTMIQQTGGASASPSVALRTPPASSSMPVTSVAKNVMIATPKRPLQKPKLVGKKNTVPDIRLPRVSTSPNQISYQRLAASPNTNVAVCRASLSMPPPASVMSSPRLVSQKWASPSSGGGGGTFRDDDDINDVASMAGVNLSEESARILATNSELVGSQIRSCKDTTIVNTPLLTKKITSTVSRHQHVQQIHSDVINFAARAVETRIKDLLEKVSLAAYHRIANFKETDHYEATQDVKSQLKFLLQLDKLEKDRHAQSEREVLMRAMKSRSKNEDPEQLRLKQRAKEMQQLEMERMQIRNADETALNAIGPRKKKQKIDSSLTKPGLSSESQDSSSSMRSSTLRPRIRRVNVKDLVFVLEQEKDTNKSKLLYKSYLK